ncbi:MAG: hypothetical protein HC905_18040 [Bacteroidales bacterium]|nr:hypothetical protein [Bacteroidales bacterium]
MKKRLKASTLLEVLVAMTIIITCAGVGLMAISNLSRDLNGDIRIEGDIYLRKVMADSQFENDYADKTFEFENIKIERSVQQYQKSTRLNLVILEAYTISGKKIGTIKEVILVNPLKQDQKDEYKDAHNPVPEGYK